MNYTVFNKETGEILRSGSCSESDFIRQVNSVEEGVMVGRFSELTHWVDGTVVKPKQSLNLLVSPSIIVADDDDYATISGIPEGCSVVIFDPSRTRSEHSITGGELEISSEVSGTFKILVGSPQHFVETIIIEAI